jgi:hypothetical protein
MQHQKNRVRINIDELKKYLDLVVREVKRKIKNIKRSLSLSTVSSILKQI